MARKQGAFDAETAAKHAILSLGRGYDIICDLRFSSSKASNGGPLIVLSDKERQKLVLPGGIAVENVPSIFKCDKGERTRFRSDVLTFDQMSQQFNQGLALSGKTPCGLFNSMFQFSGVRTKDAASTKRLALDGWFYTLYTVEMPRSNLVLKEELKALVPEKWDPAALASFIDAYGTHIIVGVKVGGKDVVYLKQQQASTLTPDELQKLLSEVVDVHFSKTERHSRKDGHSNKRYFLESEWSAPTRFYDKKHVIISPRRKGGIIEAETHSEWIRTVPSSPDVISMSFVPITSLLTGIPGNGFLSHAMNLYLKYKPPIEELRQFLEYQLPRQWAPVFGELPLTLSRKEHSPATLQFSLMGPKLKVNVTPVTVGKTPVTGMRLYLEGKRAERLAIHLQHLRAMPKQLEPLWGAEEEGNRGNDEGTWWQGAEEEEVERYVEAVQWRGLSHVCTAPVESAEAWIGDRVGASVVVGAQLAVGNLASLKADLKADRRKGSVEKKGSPTTRRSVLHLRLLYSRIAGARVRRSEWDHMPSSATAARSGAFSSFLSSTFSSPAVAAATIATATASSTASVTGADAKPPLIASSDDAFPDDDDARRPRPPASVPSRLARFVDTSEMSKGPHDLPGHWLVTGAKLCLDHRRRISLRVKYSLLTVPSSSSSAD